MLLVIVACGLGPTSAGCAAHREAIEKAEAEFQASSGREDLQEYAEAVARARQAAEAVGC